MKLTFPFRTGALAIGLVGAPVAPAAITHFDVEDIPIPVNFNGVYLNLDTVGSEAPPNDSDTSDADSYTISYSEPAEWDVNFFFGGIGIAYSDTFQPFVDETVGARSQILEVTQGTVIASEAVLRTLGVSSYGGSGAPNNGGGESHFDVPTLDADPAYSAFTPGDSSSYLAFVLNPGADEEYGWMRVTLTNDGTPGTIHEWALSDEVTFQVGQIPEPGTTALLLLGSFGIVRRKR